MKGRAKPVSSRQTAVLEITPRAAKLIVASSTSPLQIDRVNASTLSDHAGDALTALKALCEQPSGVKEAGILFGREVFSLQTLELPSVDPKEIGSMLELQLGKLTPYPRSDILFSYMPVGSFREGYTTILLAISRKALIESILQFCKTRGIAAQWVGVSTEGLEAWWNAVRTGAAQSPGQLTVIIDVDFASTDCALIGSDGRLVFTHSIPIGAEQLAASEPAKLRWLGELVRLPRILVHEDVKGQVVRGVMTGLTDGLERIAEQLVSQWGAGVEVVDALRGASEMVRAKAKVTGVSYTALAGALRLGRAPRIDLIPQETRVSQALHVRSKHLERLVVLVVLVVCAAMLLYGERMMLVSRYRAQLNEQLAPLERTARDIQAKQDAMERLRGWMNPANGALSLLRALAGAADPSVTVTQVLYKEGEPVKIRGMAATSQAPYEFLDRMKKQRVVAVGSPCAAEVRVTSTRGAEFDITCTLASGT